MSGSFRASFAVVVALVAGACKDKPAHEAKQVPRDAAPPADAAIDWKACEAALADRAPGWPRALLDKCSTCAFATILAWDKPPAQGGPPMATLAAAMTGCNAFCTGGARDRFLGTVEKARGMTRAPWRYLGEMCREAVGVDDAGMRFTSAAYFAFDRLARSVAAHGGTATQALAAIDLPLPPFTVSGNGPQLPSAAGAPGLVEVAPGQLEITLLGQTLFVGKVPHAHLDGSGIHVATDGEPYPGRPTTDLGKDLTALGAQGDVPVAVIAPTAVLAAGLAALVEHGPTGAWRLAVERGDGFGGWPDMAMLPVRLLAPGRGATTRIQLDGAPPAQLSLDKGKAVVVEVGEHATIEHLAGLLGQLAAAGFDRVGLTRRVSH